MLPVSALPSFAPLAWTFREQTWQLGGFPKLMGIVNVTPDSFSDGGQFLDPARAVAQSLQLVADGADLLDIGGESTRPGATPVSADEEIRRVVPVIAEVARRTPVPISIDTTKADVARRALDAGAAIVNDISGLRFDPEMASVCAAARAGVVCMHMQGTPQTMQDDPRYADVVGEISAYLAERLAALAERGIERERVVLDPGIGFGKTPAHNLTILEQIARFRALGRPILIGHSRKRFLSKIVGRRLDEVSAATIGVAVASALNGADLLRVHDVRATRDALAACWTVLGRPLSGAATTAAESPSPSPIRPPTRTT
jgi:dihydropteroate synthase